MSFKYKKLLVVSDHQYLLESIYLIVTKKRLQDLIDISFACSPQSNILSNIVPKVTKIDVKNETDKLIKCFDMIISAHSKQIFPARLIREIKCINIHPGLNPYNRGWYPHVFSIINKLPAGATIHEMDEQIDHGPIIIQKQVEIDSWDTSESLYNKIIQQEIILFSEIIEKVLQNNYETYKPALEGNINYKKDFELLKAIDINKSYCVKDFIDLLRALTHGEYNNSYFIDESNNKIYIKIHLEKENAQ